jgi:hypothetical protein
MSRKMGCENYRQVKYVKKHQIIAKALVYSSIEIAKNRAFD